VRCRVEITHPPEVLQILTCLMGGHSFWSGGARRYAFLVGPIVGDYFSVRLFRCRAGNCTACGRWQSRWLRTAGGFAVFNCLCISAGRSANRGTLRLLHLFWSSFWSSRVNLIRRPERKRNLAGASRSSVEAVESGSSRVRGLA